MSSDRLAPFLNSKCLNLQTYRKNGEPVQTPVWFVINGGVIYIVTPSTTGKVKRLAADKKVRIAPCDFKGSTKGDWIDATAYFANESESEQAMNLRKKKYGLMARLVGLTVYRKGSPIVVGITV